MYPELTAKKLCNQNSELSAFEYVLYFLKKCLSNWMIASDILPFFPTSPLKKNSQKTKTEETK